MAALWTVEYVGGAIRVRRHRSQADAEAYRDAVLRADGRFLTRCMSRILANFWKMILTLNLLRILSDPLGRACVFTAMPAHE